MIGINPAIKYQKMSFGAADVAAISQPIVPAPISGNPIQEKHGYIENDLYSTSNDNQNLESSPEYKKYVPHEHEKHESNMLKTLAIASVAIFAGVVLLTKGKDIARWTKSLFSKSAQDTTEISGKMSKYPPDVINFNEYNDYAAGIHNSVSEGKIKDIKLKSFRVIFNDSHKPKDRKDALEKLFKIAKVCTQKDRQPNIKLLLPESMAGKADEIVDLFRANQISSKAGEKYLNNIEGFQIIINPKRTPLSERNNIIVDKQVAYAVNAGNTSDVFHKWMRNFGEFLKGVF